VCSGNWEQKRMVAGCSGKGRCKSAEPQGRRVMGLRAVCVERRQVTPTAQNRTNVMG